MINKTIKINIIVNSDQTTAGIAKANQQIEGLNRTVGRIMRSMTAFAALWAGRQLLQGLKESIDNFAEVQHQMNLVGVATGLSTSELERLRSGLQTLAIQLGVSSEELYNFAVSVGRAGVESVDALLNIAAHTSMMAATTDIATDDASIAMIRLSKAVNLPLENYGNLASAITAVSNKTSASANQIIEAIYRIAPAGVTIGMTVDQMIALATASIEVGNTSNRAGIQIARGITQTAINASAAVKILNIDIDTWYKMLNENAIKAIMNLLEAISKIPGEAQKVKVVSDIFGGIATRSIAPLINNISMLKDNLELASSSFKNGKVHIEGYQKTMNDLHTRFTRANESLKAVSMIIGSEFAPALLILMELFMELGLAFSGVVAMVEDGFRYVNTVIDELVASVIRGLSTIFEWMGKIPGQKWARDMADDLQLYADELDKLSEKQRGEFLSSTLGYSASYIKLKEDIANAKIAVEALANIPKPDSGAAIDIPKPTPEDATAWQIYQQLATDEMNKIKAKAEELSATMGKKVTPQALQMAQMMRTGFQAVAQQLTTTLGTLANYLEVAQGESKKYAVAIKAIRISEAIINTAVGVTRALADYMWPFNIIVAGLVGAVGALQVATIASTPMKEGGIVPGIGRGDKVPAILEPGELVMPREKVSSIINNNWSSTPVINVSMAGAYVMDDPVAVRKLYREGLRDVIMNDIRTRRDNFYG